MVDHEQDHVYQPGLLFVPFGLADMGRLCPPAPATASSGHLFPQGRVDRVEVATDRVHLDDGTELGYDVLVVATGRLVVNVIDMPIKCPVAPLEFAPGLLRRP